MAVFADYAKFYDLLYKDKDYRAESDDIINLLKKYDVGPSLIVYGCGTGKHDAFLLEKGYRMHGIDLSPDMIAAAKMLNPSVEYEVADVRSYRSDKIYDGVISLFHVMSYQNANEDIRKAFRSARSSLSEGGVFIFDCWYGPGVLTDRPHLRVKKVSDEELDITRIATPVMHANDNIVDVNYEIIAVDKKTDKVNSVKETHKMRYFFKPEIEEFLLEEGFELIETLDCRTLQEPDYSSWTVYFVCKAV